MLAENRLIKIEISNAIVTKRGTEGGALITIKVSKSHERVVRVRYNFGVSINT